MHTYTNILVLVHPYSLSHTDDTHSNTHPYSSQYSHTHYSHIYTHVHSTKVLEDINGGSEPIENQFVLNWLNMLCFLLQGLPSDGTMSAGG